MKPLYSPAAHGRTPFLMSYAALALPMAAVTAALAIWGLLSHEQAMALLKEDAPVETSTAVLYFMLVPAVWIARRPEDGTRVTMALCIAFLAAGARELDLHKAWTGTSVLKLSFYLRDAPLSQKLVAVPLVLTCAAALAYLLLRFWRPVWQGLMRHEPVAVTIACFLVTMVVSKVFDRAVNITIEDFGVAVPETVHVLVSSLEEVLELSLPLIGLLGLAQRRRQLDTEARFASARRRL